MILRNGCPLDDNKITIQANRMIDLKVIKTPWVGDSRKKGLASIPKANNKAPQKNSKANTSVKCSTPSPLPLSTQKQSVSTHKQPLSVQKQPLSIQKQSPSTNKQPLIKKEFNNSTSKNKNITNLMKMASEFQGCLISVDCGENGIYQGIVQNVNPKEKSITIEKPFKEGYPVNDPTITIKAGQMVDLKILKMPVDQHKGKINVVKQQDFHQDLKNQELKKNNRQKPRKNKLNSNKSPDPINNQAPQYKVMGEFRHFQEKQVPAPIRLQINKRPSGDPLVDCSNGYTSFGNEAELGDPIDFALLDTDFDFDGNLALFNKTKFAETLDYLNEKNGENENVGNEIIKRNFRNDENVLTDPSRVTSWVNQKCSNSAEPETISETCDKSVL